MRQNMKIFGVALIAVIAAMGFYLWRQYDGQTGKGIEIVKKAEAAGGKVINPSGTAPDRYVYYPGNEDLKAHFEQAWEAASAQGKEDYTVTDLRAFNVLFA
jgi:hypothetical protein